PAAKAATATIPIVFLIGGDPVDLGLVETMSHPGGHVTGVAVLNVDLIAKRLELLHELVPNAKTVVVLLNRNSTYTAPEITHVQTAARSLQVRLVLAQVSDENEIN